MQPTSLTSYWSSTPYMRHAGCSALRQHPARRIPGAAQFWRWALLIQIVRKFERVHRAGARIRKKTGTPVRIGTSGFRFELEF